MSNSGRSVLILCLALFSCAELEGATLQIQVYDYALLGPVSLGKTVSELEDILRYTGVSVQVRVCRGSVAVVCGDQEGPVIRILPGNAKTMLNLRRPPLGRSFATKTGGNYATIFLAAVQDQAAVADTPWVVVLAHAAAHETGHLLLGNQAHTQRIDAGDLGSQRLQRDDSALAPFLRRAGTETRQPLPRGTMNQSNCTIQMSLCASTRLVTILSRATLKTTVKGLYDFENHPITSWKCWTTYGAPSGCLVI